MKHKYKDLIIEDFTINGKCSGCGQCCGDILHLSQTEIKRIDYFLSNNKIEETERSILFDYDNTCPFRDSKNKKCKIYQVRPDICKVYQCNKSPLEAYKNRELTNKGKLPRSMRNLFFNDNTNALFIENYLKIPIYDRNNKIISSNKDN